MDWVLYFGTPFAATVLLALVARRLGLGPVWLLVGSFAGWYYWRAEREDATFLAHGAYFVDGRATLWALDVIGVCAVVAMTIHTFARRSEPLPLWRQALVGGGLSALVILFGGMGLGGLTALGVLGFWILWRAFEAGAARLDARRERARH